MAKIQVGLKSCSFHRRLQWWNSFCPTRPLLARRAKNVPKIVPRTWSPRGKLELSSPRDNRKTWVLVTSRREKKTLTLVTSRIALREVTNDKVFLWARGDEIRPLCTNFRDIFGSPDQEEPSWAKWVSPSISSVKTTTFKHNLYFYHRIPLSLKSAEKEGCAIWGIDWSTKL